MVKTGLLTLFTFGLPLMATNQWQEHFNSIVNDVSRNAPELIHLHCNVKLGSTNLSKLIEALRNNTTVTHLYLVENDLGNDGAIKIATYLESNSTLLALTLCNNNIEDGGYISLTEALKKNSTLKELKLDENKIRTPGITSLATFIKLNTSLDRLSIDKICINPDDYNFIVGAIAEKFTLMDVHFNWKDSSGITAEAFSKTCKERNLRLRSLAHEGITVICCLTFPENLLPKELINLLLIAYYTRLALNRPPLPT